MDPTSSAPRPRTLTRRILHLVRRIHLYTGLFLIPWLVMYAVTAILFNHPNAFPDQPGTSFGPAETAGTPLAEMRPASDVAADVVAELNRQAGRERYRLVRPEAAAYRGDFASAVLRADGQAYQVFVDVRDGSGFARLRIDPPKEPAPFAAPKGFPGGSTVAGQLKEGLSTTLPRAGLPPGDVTVTLIPDLMFDVSDGDGRTWRAAYNPLHGTLGGVPAESVEPLTSRRFLTRLHVTRGYPSSPGLRWFWALSVDVVSVAMLFWVLSGLVMWWQIRAVRVSGLAVLLLSALAAIGLGVGMHAQFAP